MSGAILDNLDYIKLLLDTTRIQGECLLDTASPSQIRALSQICRNLKNLSLDPVIVDAITRKKKLFKILSSKKNGIRQKGRLISKNRRFLLSIILTIKPILVSLINHFMLRETEQTLDNSLQDNTKSALTGNTSSDKTEKNVG